jgi:hypothetical protein
MIIPALGEVAMDEDKVDEREWQVAKVVESNEEATFVVGFLNSSGIPAEAESLHVEELPVNLGGLGEVRVRVPADRLAEAQAALDLRDTATPFADLGDLDDDPQGADQDAAAGASPSGKARPDSESR